MKRIRLSNRVKILALVATAAILGAACSPALVAPGATSAGQAGAVEAALKSISGVVETMSADSWTVGGQEVAITAQTEIASSIRVGDSVQVQVERMPDGRLAARQIEPGDSGDDNANGNDNSADDNANDNGSNDNGNDNGNDDNGNDNSADDNGNDNTSQDDDNGNDNGADDNSNDNGNQNGGDDNSNDSDGDSGNDNDNANTNG